MTPPIISSPRPPAPSLVSAQDWQTASRWLALRDPVMARLASRYQGQDRLQSRGEPFHTLARAIVGQQISVKAADTIWLRVASAAGVMPGETARPEQICRLIEARGADGLQDGLTDALPAGLQGLGLSSSKQRYLANLAEWFVQNPDLPEQLQQMDDEAVVQTLVARPGIGRWTAEMFLIFTLLRPNVFPVDDLAILKAMGQLYFDGQLPSKAQAKAHAEQWRPYRTVASWLLWRQLDPDPVEY